MHSTGVAESSGIERSFPRGIYGAEVINGQLKVKYSNRCVSCGSHNAFKY